MKFKEIIIMKITLNKIVNSVAALRKMAS